MSLLPLVAHSAPDSIVAWRAAGAVTLRQFLAEVRQLAGLLPPAHFLLNLCGDRYRFSVGLAAAIVAGKTTLLPSAQNAETIRQIKRYASDTFCLLDSALSVDLPTLQYPLLEPPEIDNCTVPSIDSSQRVAVIFTSGSTGTPQPHPKTWGAMVSSMQAEALRLGLPSGPTCTLVGTVPPQHMYGFEATVLLAWQSGHALSHAQPFYPADIAQALAAVPLPRVLVSSPMHLRALLGADLPLPEISQIISSTAPLPAELAQAVEIRCSAPLTEIYGSTETGLLATRRTAQTDTWQLLPGIKLRADNDGVHACGGHVDSMMALHDRIELLDEQRFLLLGRKADLINIAGKRHSLASLNHLLTAIPGVIDGAFYMPDESPADRVTRLAACVVAPDLTAAALLAALRERLDPVFLPRPLLFVDALPRNNAGKLPRAALQALLQSRIAPSSA